MIIGISGTSLGAILRSKKNSYTEIGKVGLVFGLFVGVLSFLFSLGFGSAIIEMFLTNGVITTLFETLSVGVLAIVSGLILGITAGVSLFIGAGVYDISVWIMDTF